MVILLGDMDMTQVTGIIQDDLLESFDLGKVGWSLLELVFISDDSEL